MTPAPDNFLGLPPQFCNPRSARYAVLPVPYEGTVSYAKGTAGGPAAILNASQQVEWFDDELHAEFYEAGAVTCPAVEPTDDPGETMRRVAEAARPVVGSGKFLLTLGGEHSITAPLVAEVAARYGPLSVLQIDAHADLRDSYGGTKHSHASVMRRVRDIAAGICQVGIRNYSQEEFDACPREVANFITPRIVRTDPQWVDRALALLGERVYVTVDIDGFDPSVAPGTGTPEPGGLLWHEGLELLRRVCAERQVVAADIVEVRPIPPNHCTEFAAARLAYKLMAYTQCGASRRTC